MSTFSLSPYLLIKLLFGVIVFLVFGSALNVASETRSLSSNLATTNNEIEIRKAAVMDVENCFPDCNSQFNLDQRLISLQSRLSYYKDIQEKTFTENLKDNIQINDATFALVVALFLTALIFTYSKDIFLKNRKLISDV